MTPAELLLWLLILVGTEGPNRTEKLRPVNGSDGVTVTVVGQNPAFRLDPPRMLASHLVLTGVVVLEAQSGHLHICVTGLAGQRSIVPLHLSNEIYPTPSGQRYYAWVSARPLMPGSKVMLRYHLVGTKEPATSGCDVTGSEQS